MPLPPRVRIIRTDSGAKLLQLFVVGDSDGYVLVDAGLAQTPMHAVAPYFQSEGLSFDRLLAVIVTHADVDHYGGVHELLRVRPQLSVIAGAADVPLITSWDTIWEQRYHRFARHGVRYDQPVVDWLVAAAGGGGARVTEGTEGHTVYLPSGDRLELMAIPGHTPGHLAVVNREYGYAMIGDAILDRGEPDLAGQLFAPPTYVSVSDYLNSIARLEAVGLEWVFRAHVAPLHGPEVSGLWRRSRQWVADVQTVLWSELRAGPRFFAALIGKANEMLGPYIAATDLAFAIEAHLTDWERQGLVCSRAEDTGTVWERA